MGSNYVMPSVAAAVVGGVSLTGGDGNYLGVILGAIFLQTLTNLLVALGWGDAGKWLGFGIVLFIPPDRLREQPAQQVGVLHRRFLSCG
jgi:ribose transport system permease protein